MYPAKYIFYTKKVREVGFEPTRISPDVLKTPTLKPLGHSRKI